MDSTKTSEEYRPPLKELLELGHQTTELEKVLLDPNNPRLAVVKITPDSRVHEESVQKATQEKLETNGIDDLVLSIKRYGFVQSDPIVVRSAPQSRFVVLEGNRRVASLRKLSKLQQSGEINLEKLILDSMRTLQVLVYEGKDPDIAWLLQGLRHMSGTKPWPPLQQAAFVAKIEEQMKKQGKRRGHPPGIPTVGKAAGVTTGTATRLLMGVYGFRQAKEDEEFGSKLKDDQFSFFFEVIFRDQTLQKWLGWDEVSRKFKNTDNLRKFLSWITPPNGGGEARITRALDARDVLPEILSNPDFLRQFERGSMDINDARVQIERRNTREPDLDSVKKNLKDLSNTLESLPLARIQREDAVNDFLKLLEQLKQTIEFNMKALGKR